MRFRLRSLFWVVSILAVVSALLGLWMRSIDGISGNLFALLLPEDTEWAPGYTDEGFRAARAGMTRREIYALLGPPLYTWENYGGAEVVEWWTRSPEDGHYRQRAVIFHGDKAVRKVGQFWVD